MNKHINHCHVTVVSSEMSIPPIIVTSELDAIIEYDKRVQILMDVIGATIEKRGINIVTFTNGDTVKWRVCRGDCMEEQVETKTEKTSRWPRLKKETEFIF